MLSSKTQLASRFCIWWGIIMVTKNKKLKDTKDIFMCFKSISVVEETKLIKSPIVLCVSNNRDLEVSMLTQICRNVLPFHNTTFQPLEWVEDHSCSAIFIWLSEKAECSRSIRLRPKKYMDGEEMWDGTVSESKWMVGEQTDALCVNKKEAHWQIPGL